ncbi:hypothetical protein HMPREF0063_10444 [Aeromicrobium marinum DSM 15272]|uniref:DUF881 domain-containing protein n=1 Tax=Aeromicrobium marinum DSM 15272 TaxID=585531 RepID=E2S8T7_9ACTN|nr:hypothetical protein HMPREF0063_10444 [Aeromicrobium marinum DSM 15272]
MAALVVTGISGFVFVSGAVTSRGTDIRPLGGDITSVVEDRARQVEARRTQASTLQQQIDELSEAADVPGLDEVVAAARAAEAPAGFTAVEGPGLRVTLTDTPRSVEVAEGLDPNVLVVHQQDIQGFVNALWAGGAQAVTLQGQRLISTTGIKCVGSTVVLDGVPYSPPYVIEAVGGDTRLRAALDASPEVGLYETYVSRYKLGLQVETVRTVQAPAYDGALSVQFASAVTP